MKLIEANIGQVIIGDDKTCLQTILGSCVGILFIWQAKNIYGLAHCFLPESLGQKSNEEGKYVDHAINSLIQKMQILPENIKDIQVILLGGGNPIVSSTKKEKTVGFLNLQSSRKLLNLHGFTFKEMAVASSSGIKVKFNCSTQKILIQQLN